MRVEAEPVLHEYVRPPTRGSHVIAAPGEKPAVVRQDDRLLVAPQVARPPDGEEPVHGERGFAVDRETESRPDYATQKDGTLHYVEVFNPSVVPFKRMTALDAVRSDYTLYASSRDLRPIDVVPNGRAPERDLFWASLVVELPTGGGPVAIPSVAPDMRVLSAESSPAVELAFARDQADNFYLRATGGATGRHRVVLLVDAPAVYFAARVPTGISVAKVAAEHPPAALPPRVRASAQVMLVRLGILPTMPVDAVLAKLIEYFRSFEAGTPPSPSGDVYLDLALSRRGVCRHRAFAFMITANAIGVPARYVANEAHAFAEVWVPESGWLRIDLGGAALEMDVANADGKVMYRPRAEDPFPKPSAYADNYTRLRGSISGLSADQINAAAAPRANRPAESDPRSTEPVAAAGVALPRVTPVPNKKSIRLTIDGVDKRTFRGESARITGHATGAGSDLRIDIYFAPAGSRGERARLIGQTVTDAAGNFELAVELPRDLPLGQHEVYAATPGNTEIAAATSD